MHLYLDLDGVILRQSDSVAGIELAPHALSFLHWAVEGSSTVLAQHKETRTERISGVLRAFRLAMGCATLPTEVVTLTAPNPA
jgi:hypothetical protein